MSWPVAAAVALLVNAACVAIQLRWFLVPMLRRRGRPVWTSCAMAFLAIVVFEPARDTFSYGQVNPVLLVWSAATCATSASPGWASAWAWWADPLGWEAFPGGNAYVWLTLAVLVVLTQQVHVDARRRLTLATGAGFEDGGSRSAT